MEEALYLAALKYLNFRPRSEKETRDYLKKKLTKFPNAPLSLIDIIVYKLKQQKFINDEEFAKMWVRSRTQFRPKGFRLIKLELKQKGISEEIIKRIESGVLNNELGARDEVDLATELVEKRRKKFEPMDKQERFNKIGSMLARRGFNLDTIRKAIDRVFGK